MKLKVKTWENVARQYEDFQSINRPDIALAIRKEIEGKKGEVEIDLMRFIGMKDEDADDME